MKKKTLAILLSTMLTFSMLTACGNSEEVNASVTTETMEEAASNEDTSTEPSTEPIVEENHDGMYRSELTNEWIDEAFPYSLVKTGNIAFKASAPKLVVAALSTYII